MTYYGTRLSENISRREPEGYLFCLNVPVARTGIQEYMPEELGLPPGPNPVPVSRSETEVFSPETIASFEGMPVTNNHPPDGVTVDNIRALQKGHAHNVRRGAGEEADLLLADLIITDPVLIDAILSGKREISCGYTYELHEENGQYFQRKIHGNHVAVVDAGRAGPRVSIKDTKPQEKSERSQPIMKKSLLKKLTRMARDGDPEAIEALAEAVEEIIEAPSTEEAVVIAAAAEPDPAPEEPSVVVETPEGETVVTDDEPGIGEVLARLDQIIQLLTPAAPVTADEDPVEEIAAAVEEALETAVEAESPADPELAEAAEEVAGEIAHAEGLMSETIGEEDCGTQDPRPSADAVRATLAAMRPQLARMSRKERKKVCADIAAQLKKTGTDARDYAALVSARPRRDSDPADLGRKIMAKRNPNFKE